MDTETTFSRWLRVEMGARGYPVGEPRSGGISRLAEDAGVPQASLSRILNGHAEPSLDNLRKIGRVFGLSLPEMMINAGFMEIEELQHASLALGPFTEDGLATISASLDFNRMDPSFPPMVRESWASYELWQRAIWHLPGLSDGDKAFLVTQVCLRWAAIKEGEDKAVAEIRDIRSGKRAG